MGTVVVAWFAVGLLLLAVGAFLPGLGLLGDVGTAVAATTAAPSVVVGLVVIGAALLVRKRFRRVGAVLAGVSGVGTAAALVICGLFWSATTNAGGSINPLLAMFPNPSTNTAPDEHTVYTTTPSGQELRAAVYRSSAANSSLLVYVHGGGWVAGSELDRGKDMRWFADRGWTVVSVEYTLATDELHTWDVAGPQVGCALRWAVERAPGWGADGGRVALLGDSAGGQLAVTTAYLAAQGKAVSSCGGQVPRVGAVAVQYPAVDPVGGYENGYAFGDSLATDTRRLGRAYFGGTPAEVPERYRALSGEAVVSAQAPPTLVISPDDDVVVPAVGVRRFVDVARRGGVAVTSVALPFANHAYDTGAQGSLGNQARLSVTEGFLRRVLPVTGD
ncbi:alpha/beta hydrolase [Actinokineospora bangkokensis]|uniref:alpha/beta hydrolase n=1 Tax=Actinokineospora bangkokensis TaxID=1193682 RepID=UPI001300DAB4|nr:alpha/beta hydrolase [Actinokineospora bangkokensis]